MGLSGTHGGSLGRRVLGIGIALDGQDQRSRRVSEHAPEVGRGGRCARHDPARAAGTAGRHHLLPARGTVRVPVAHRRATDAMGRVPTAARGRTQRRWRTLRVDRAVTAYRQTPALEFRCGRGHRHEPRADYDIASGHCAIWPCGGMSLNPHASRIRRVFVDGHGMSITGAECVADSVGRG